MNHTRKLKYKLQIGLTTLASACLLACGGSNTTASSDAQMTGTAAYGSPMAGAAIVLTDAAGQTVSATSGADGTYTVKVTGFTAPFLVKASLGSGDSVKEYLALVTAAPKVGETGTANVTPLTHALVTMASSDGASPNEFSDTAKLKALDSTKLTAALGNLQTALKEVLADAGLPGTFDPLTSTLKADRNSPADVLLDTIKVTVSDQGVGLTNARVPVNNDSETSNSATVTIKGTPTVAPAALPKPTVAVADMKGLDGLQIELNNCLALAPAARASKAVNGVYTLLGACANMTGFASNYKGYGYTLSQLYGPRLLNTIPEGSSLDTPEFLLFLDNGNKALVRLASKSKSGGLVYFEIAAKGADGKWTIVGNQRDFDASIGTALYRQADLSTYGSTIAATAVNSPDKGKNIGRFNAYSSRLNLNFNPQGPNAANVYAVRVKGPGLPTSGVVLARSSGCGTNDYLAFYSNNGSLPAAALATPTSSTGNQWILDVKNMGTDYTGTDFYNQYRGLATNGSPSTSTANITAATPVDMQTITEFAVYTWEVFKTASGSTPAATFTSRIVARPLAPSEGSKQPWANLSADTLDYLKPASTSKTGELSTASVGWSLPSTTAPVVASAYMIGSGTANGTAVTMNMSQSVAKLGDTSLSLTAAAESNGLGQACTYDKLPAFTATTGSRSAGTRQTTERGLRLQSYSYHSGRTAN
jgi:hypothetical protein